MARLRQPVRLEDGLKLGLNKLLRAGFWSRQNASLTVGTQWTSSRQCVLANALLTIKKFNSAHRHLIKVPPYVLFGATEFRRDGARRN